jgi:guanylate kinase
MVETFRQDTLKRRGLMLVLSSPSGAGKTTIAKSLLMKDSKISLSISKTTRAPRTNEVNGKDYIFTDKQGFLKDIENGVFLEHAEVFGNFYGTPKKEVEDTLEKGLDVLFDIDWQGAQQIQAKAPQDLVSIFILPPSMDILTSRLMSRATDSQEVIERRLKEAVLDISHFAEYDYVLINDDVESCIQNVRSILKAERLKRHRLIGAVDFVNKMRTS